jgi:malate synthase
MPAASGEVLTPDAIGFVNELAERFSQERDELLARRAALQRQFDAGALPDFPEETQALREADWKIGSIPADLLDRRVEITGPPERKMVINALNSGANVFMADFEDSLCPTWANLIDGQANLMQAVRRTLTHETPEGKAYRLNEKTAVLPCGRADGTCGKTLAAWRRERSPAHSWISASTCTTTPPN